MVFEDGLFDQRRPPEADGATELLVGAVELTVSLVSTVGRPWPCWESWEEERLKRLETARVKVERREIEAGGS